MDEGSAVRPHRNRVVRGVLVAVGTILVAIGIVGIFLPLLPSTIFLLGGAACYARASQRFYDRLLASRLGGPLLREWREHRTVARRAKITALIVITLTFATTTTFFVPGVLPRVLVVFVGVGVFTIVARLPERTRPAPEGTPAGPETSPRSIAGPSGAGSSAGDPSPRRS